MSSLYRITEQLIALDQLLEEVGGDVTEGTQGEALEKWVKEYEWQQRDKVDAYCQLVSNLKADIDAISEEAKRLNERGRVLFNRIERLKSLAKVSMDMRGVKRLEGQKFTIALQKNGGKDPIELLVEDPKGYPLRFVKIERTPDKEALREALAKNDPEAAKFARLGERGESVRIR